MSNITIDIITAKFALEYLKKVIRSGPVLDVFEQAIKANETIDKPTPSPIVELSLEDAKMLFNNFGKGTIVPDVWCNFREAITKAESHGKGDLKECLKRDDENFRETLVSSSLGNNQMRTNGGITNKTAVGERVEDDWGRLNRLRDFKPVEDNPDIARLKCAIAGLENDRSNIVAVLNQIQSRYDKLEETVRKSILSAHVRLGGITPQ